MDLYCVKCKKIKKSIDLKQITSKNNRLMLSGKCSVCNSKVFRFIKHGNGLLNNIMNKVSLPEMHMSLPDNIESEDGSGKYSYCGPGTKLHKRLSKGHQGVNDLDRACMKHDIAYDNNRDTKSRNEADNELAHISNKLANDMNQPDYVRKDAKKVAALMSLKSYFGMGLNNTS